MKKEILNIESSILDLEMFKKHSPSKTKELERRIRSYECVKMLYIKLSKWVKNDN